MIRLESVSKAFDPATFAVRDVSLEVGPGEFLALLGGSGSGKTTTLKMMNRLIEPTSGRIVIDGEDVLSLDPVRLRRRIGYVFQGIGLFPHLSVGRNVAVVPELLGWVSETIRNRVDELLELVRLPPDEYRDRMPTSLSGGQQQRVGLARALAARPKIVLMDEPFGALDPITREALRSEYLDLHRRLGLTTVMVTHDMTEALLMADRIAVLRSGTLLRVGTARELASDPGDPYVARLLESPRQQSLALEALLVAQGDA